MTTLKNENDALSITLLCGEGEFQTADVVLMLEQQVDLASRQSLMPYDDGRPWIVVDDRQVMLGAVAHAMINGATAQLANWHHQGWLAIYPSLEQIPGDTFRVLWFENAYVLAPYPPGQGHHSG